MGVWEVVDCVGSGGVLCVGFENCFWGWDLGVGDLGVCEGLVVSDISLEKVGGYWG